MAEGAAALSAADSQETSRTIAYPIVVLISVGHLMNDLYGNLMTSLTPYLILRGQMTAAVAGLVLLVYLLGSSVLQPIFGLLSDRSGRRIFVIVGPLWIGITASLFGWAPDPLLLLLLAGLGGVGTAAFHPQAASMVDSVSPQNKGWTMSIFSMGGNVGFALGPLAAATIAMAGLHWTLIIPLPGIVLTFLLARYAPYPRQKQDTSRASGIGTAASAAWRDLARIISVIAIRSGLQIAVIILLPLYFHARGLPAQQGSYLAFTLSLSGAAGGLIGGKLSDRYGRRRIVTGTLLFSAPILFMALISVGLLSWFLIAVAGGALLASNSVTVVQAQERLPGSTGVASGLTLGFGFGLSGIIASSSTALSEHFGVITIMHVLPLLSLLAAVVALWTPDVNRIGRTERAAV